MIQFPQNQALPFPHTFTLFQRMYYTEVLGKDQKQIRLPVFLLLLAAHNVQLMHNVEIHVIL